jgi:uncharacterized cupredoxin-like copper-binding protein
MRTTTTRLGARLGLMAGAALLVAGCGGASSGGTAATSSGGAGGTTVTATETEFSITLSQKTFTPGLYTFQVTNKGKFSHNLTIEGPGVQDQASNTVPGGQNGRVTVTLKAGSYELYCSVDGHKDQGMDLKITVA